ncbi:MAG TPA: tetratricopeptide repeat protein, partial [Labilithrix sp.]|nr:tetratricopeptide repeat protein [Labilithrix sp.]
MRWLSTTLACALLITSATAASAQGVCITDKARQALACPGGAARDFDAAQGRAGVKLHTVAPPAKAAPAQAAPAKWDGSDDRKIRLEARQRVLLTVEVQRIESLFSTSKRNAPDRMQLARRLADGYVELESAAFRDKTEAEMRRDALVRQKSAAAGEQQTQVNELDRITKAARKRAIEMYTLVAADYPTASQLDEVLYYLAYEYEQAGDAKNARAAYYALIQKAPTSKYIPNAYLAFGELFFAEAQGDPAKWDLALQAYSEVIKYPPPANKAFGYAWYKTAYVYWNKGELDKALNAFKRTIELGVAHPTLPGATKLADSARRDVIPVYALKGDPAQAYPFLHALSGDAAGSNDKTFHMLDDLGTSYIDTGHYPEGI